MQGIIARVGGKRKLKDIIIELIPPHVIYCEPFVGGGAVFFGKEKSDIEIVNDLDKDIFHIYSDMKVVGEKMVNKDFGKDKELFLKLMKQKKIKNREDRLFRNIYISLHSFKGDRKSWKGKDKPIKHFGKKWKNERYKERLKDVIIENKDWKSLIKAHDSKETFFYLDPPYSMASKNKDYKHNDVSINELYNTLKNINGKFLLSYDYNNEIKERFRDFNIKVVETTYSTKKGSMDIKKKEYLISNY
jgi:DNA adenine methylase